MSSPKIGILDSGVGGLSVLREIHARLPACPIHFVGDSAWCPYGNKPPGEIQQRVSVITEYLLEQGAELIVVACNSATIQAVELLRATYPVSFVGMEPAVKPAAELTRSGIIGVLATEASIAGEKFHNLVDNHAASKGVRVITRACPKFVELVEMGMLDGEEVTEAIGAATDPLLAEGADTLVLGCTHYPFLRKAIEAHLPAGVALLDTGAAVAKRVVDLLGVDDQGDSGRADQYRIETTGELAKLEALLPRLLPGFEASTGRVEFA